MAQVSPAKLIEAGIAAERNGQLTIARAQYLEATRQLLVQAQMVTGEPRKRLYDQAQRLKERVIALDKLLAAQSAKAPVPPAALRSGEKPEAAEGEAVPEWLLGERPSIRLDDVAGLEDVKEQIKIKLIYPFSHPTTAETYGVRPGGGILLYGPPGTGKTFIARAIAGELDAAFFVAKSSNLMSQWFGKAEQNIAALFKAARAQPRSVIFLDEIEAMIPKRGANTSSVMPRVISEFLSQTQSIGDQGGALLLLGATNEPWSIDAAALRPGRFDELIYVGLPDYAARLRLLELSLNDRPLDLSVELAGLATRLEGYSGADISYICKRAGELAFLSAVATGEEMPIGEMEFAAVLTERRPSVTGEMLQKYERFRFNRTR